VRTAYHDRDYGIILSGLKRGVQRVATEETKEIKRGGREAKVRITGNFRAGKDERNKSGNNLSAHLRRQLETAKSIGKI